MAHTPYSHDLGDHDAQASLRDMLRDYSEALAPLDEATLSQPLAPGKWTIAQLMTHLLHTEMAFSLRVRMAVTTDGYVIQPFEQDLWMSHEMNHTGGDAIAAWTSLRRLNLAYFAGLTPEALSRPATHPEYGPISPQWIIEALAGHDRHHWPQLTRALAGR